MHQCSSTIHTSNSYIATWLTETLKAFNHNLNNLELGRKLGHYQKKRHKTLCWRMLMKS